MPEATFTSYLRLALRARGLDPDEEGSHLQATEPPPVETLTIDDLPEESRTALRRALQGG